MTSGHRPTGRLLAGLGLLLALATFAAAPVGASEPDPRQSESSQRVLVSRVDTTITPVVADHLGDGLQQAEAEGFDAYVIELDTPGGLVTSMRDIVGGVLASPVPVVVYVSPAGARAASAGAVITLAAHVAVMAPGTTIGAATPVDLEGAEVSDKVVNDAAAQAESLARLRGRDPDFAVDMVRQGRSATVDEALELGVVDARARDLPTALEVSDGRRVALAGGQTAVLRTAGAAVERYDLGLFRKILQVLADPNVAFLLLTIGTLGLIYELATPGVGVAGATGVTALLLALFSLSVLPVNIVGLLLLAVAAGLFAAEAFAPGVAGFAFGGAAVLLLSTVFLFDDAQGVSVDPVVAVPTAVLAAVAAVLAGRVVLRTRRMPSTHTGAESLAGREVTVVTADGPNGRTFTEGGWWTVRSTGADLFTGQRARVLKLDGLVLVVEPLTTEPGGESARPQEAT